MTNTENPQIQLAFDFVRFTNKNIFLTGKAGTGKTTFLRNLKRLTPKRMVVVAPTGVAAINAGGVTIHSFFQISFGPQVPQENPSMTVSSPGGLNAPTSIKRYSKEKINIIRSLDLLVIDEISMVRADLLDAIDEVLRRFRDRKKPFGGVQLLMIGDLQQLSPVVKEDEWNILKSYYNSCYFFSSRALRQSSFTSIELKQIYRQSDGKFIDLLNRIRENKLDFNSLTELNKRYIANFNPPDKEGYITLTTHNYQAQNINQAKLKELKNQPQSYEAVIDMDFPEYMYPTDQELVLKTGAQVMFVKNDSSMEKRFYNGKIGTIVKLDEDMITVSCKGDTEPIHVERAEWQNAKYTLNNDTQEIEEQVIGTFQQFPLKLAWAITIHKSQGLTFEKAIINARQSFAHGQVYVALSRCKSLEGLVLSTPIELDSIKNDETVITFTDQVEANQPGEKELQIERLNFQKQLLSDLFDFNPVLRQIRYLQKLCNEHGSLLLGNLPSYLQKMSDPLKTELVDVASKFEHQVNQLIPLATDAEQNPKLQERIKKACEYFLEKTETELEKPLTDTSFETDNKAIRKSFNEALEKLHHEIRQRKLQLKSCTEGFNMKNYLDTRAKAAIDFSGFETLPSDIANRTKHPVFYKKIKAWRARKAEESGISLSRVISQKSMVEISDDLPATLSELKSIKGLGGKKMQQFGKEILEMTIAYRKETGMELPLNAEKEPLKAILDTKHTSLALFKSGKNITDIARERQLAVTTIEGHLAHFVGKGELDINKLVEQDKREAITRQITKSDTPSLSGLKAALGDQYTYAEIRYVLSYYQAKQTDSL